MPISLTLIPANAPISATTLRARLQTMETYVNEGIVAGDRAAGWLTADAVYRPDFYGDPNPHTTLVSGESYFRQRSMADELRSWFSYRLTTQYLPIPGLQATIEIPETLSQGTYYYRLVVCASFYVYEYGGDDDEVDEDTNLAGGVYLFVNGQSPSATSRNIYKGSRTSEKLESEYYPRKQFTITRALAGGGSPLTTGVNNVGFYIKCDAPSSEEWKHLIVQQGSMIVRYFLR